MNEAQPASGKILRGTEGIGTVTPQMIEERARKLARSDGRSQPNDLDRTRANKSLPSVVGEKIGGITADRDCTRLTQH